MPMMASCGTRPCCLGPGEREERRAQRGEAERVDRRTPSSRTGAREDGHRRAERRHLGQREVHEDHLARDDVEAEVGVDRHDDQAGHERRQQEAVDQDRASGAPSREAGRETGDPGVHEVEVGARPRARRRCSPAR